LVKQLNRFIDRIYLDSSFIYNLLYIDFIFVSENSFTAGQIYSYGLKHGQIDHQIKRNRHTFKNEPLLQLVKL